MHMHTMIIDKKFQLKLSKMLNVLFSQWVMPQYYSNLNNSAIND